MILAPRYIPRIAATVGLFTRYGLLDFAKRQGLASIEGLGAVDGHPDDKDVAEVKTKALLTGMEKIANRILVGLVLAGPLIASSVMLQFWQTLGLVGIIIAVGLALYVLITILVNDRKDKQRAAGG